MTVGKINERSIGFSTYLDLSHFLESFECLRTDEYLGEDEGGLVPPLACEFCKVKSQGHILAVVDENGFIVIYNTNRTGQRAIVEDWQAHNNAVFDMTWVDSDQKILTASGDQTAALWDVQTQEKIDIFRGHTSSVRSICLQKECSSVFVTGSRDGHVMVWDTRCNKKDGHIAPVNIIRNAHTIPLQVSNKSKCKRLGPSRDSQMSVTAVKFQTDVNLFSAGTVDGCIKVWDLRKTYSNSTGDAVAKGILTYPGSSKRCHGYSSLAFDSTYSQLFASCRDDSIYQFDVINLNPRPVHSYRGHQNGSFFIKACVSPDNGYLLSGSTDEMAYIYKIGKPKQSPIVLKGHRLEVSDVKWCPSEFSKIATLSDDNTMRIWRLHRRQSKPNPDEVTGIAERTHREIGVSVDDLDKRVLEQNSVSSNQSTTEGKPEMIKSLSSPARLISPSIKKWFSLSAHKKKQTEEPSTDAEGSSNKNRNIFGNTRLPCKRKLVDDDDGSDSASFEKFTKRRKMNDSPVKLPDSPRKLTIKNSPRKQDNKYTPGKLQISDSPVKTKIEQISRKLEMQEGPKNSETVQTEMSVLKDKNSSEKRCDLLSPHSIPSPLSEKMEQLASNTGLKNVKQLEKQDLFNLSPTVNLPNFVLDGNLTKINSYYTYCDKQDKENSPQKIDWLTKLRQQKKVPNVDFEKNSPKRTLSDKIFESPSRTKTAQLVESPSTPRSSNPSSSQSSQEEMKSPAPKGMRPLYTYFMKKQTDT